MAAVAEAGLCRWVPLRTGSGFLFHPPQLRARMPGLAGIVDQFHSRHVPSNDAGHLSYAGAQPSTHFPEYMGDSLEEDKVTEVTIFLSMVFPHLKALR